MSKRKFILSNTTRYLRVCLTRHFLIIFIRKRRENPMKKKIFYKTKVLAMCEQGTANEDGKKALNKARLIKNLKHDDKQTWME